MCWNIFEFFSLQENGHGSETLMAVNIAAVSYDDCKKTYSYLTPRMMCASDQVGGGDSCKVRKCTLKLLIIKPI